MKLIFSSRLLLLLLFVFIYNIVSLNQCCKYYKNSNNNQELLYSRSTTHLSNCWSVLLLRNKCRRVVYVFLSVSLSRSLARSLSCFCLYYLLIVDTTRNTGRKDSYRNATTYTNTHSLFAYYDFSTPVWRIVNTHVLSSSLST